MSDQIFSKVWYRSDEKRPWNLLAFQDAGTLTIGKDHVEFKGRKQTIHIADIQRISYGRQGADWVHNWVTIEYGDAKRAFLADGRLMGYSSLFGGTKKILRAAQHVETASVTNTNSQQMVNNSGHCPACGHEDHFRSNFCRECGTALRDGSLPRIATSLGNAPVWGHTGDGLSTELNSYLLKAQGINRTTLNVMAFVGIFIFGWLMAVIFEFLGKGKMGWVYCVPIAFLVIGVRQFEPTLALLAIPIYITAWVHANLVLSGYQSAARKRIAEIDRRKEPGIDRVMEHGLLLHKVLNEKQSAADVLASALSMPGGDPVLLNLCGVMMFAGKRFNEAGDFFDRALTSAKEPALVRQIKKNQSSVRKKWN